MYHNNKYNRVVILGALVFCLTFSSFFGGLASMAMAAEVNADQQDTTSGLKQDNSVVKGLLAVGLIAILAQGKGKKTTTGATQGSSTNEQPSTGQTTLPSPSTSTNQGLTADEKRAVNLLNADRQKAGLAPLKVNMSLVRLAEKYGQDMIARNYFSHYNPEGQTPFDRMRLAGISYRYAGENLAINTSVDKAQVAFMNSSGHRANVLNPNYTEVGIGVSYKSNVVYVVQEFIGK